MADEAQSIRSLNWRELFPFINVFRAFRVAIHPSKLVLGFALIFLLYAGGRVLDAVWPSKYYAVSTELDQYTGYKWSHDQTSSFGDKMDAERETNAQEYSQHLLKLRADGFVDLGTDKDKYAEVAMDRARHGGDHRELQRGIVRHRNKGIEDAKKAETDQDKQIDDSKDIPAEKKVELKQKAHEQYESTYRELQTQTLAAIANLNAATPRGLFDEFFEYESRQFHNVVGSALNWNWFNGVVGASQDVSPEAAGRPTGSHDDPNVGVLRCVANLTLIGPGWLVRYHTIYFILFAVWFLLVWAVFGGAIARIAAVHVSRDEKISVRQALRFSTSKLLSFVFAPVIPLIIIAVAGLVIAVGGLLLYVPVLGPIIFSVLFLLALLAGFVVTLVGTGTVGGINLMYPTIAVEGSDSFDAISRSFSYVFARPWRMIFYTVISLIYGSLCFLFVRFFVYVMLSLTHFFAGAFLSGQSHRYWPEIWPAVSDQDMAYRINFQALSWSDSLAAFIIAMWVYMVLTLLASFVVSFYFSSNTIIYFLMRREVDATELDDVYIEETEEDFAEPAAAVTPTPAAVAVVPPPAAPPA